MDLGYIILFAIFAIALITEVTITGLVFLHQQMLHTYMPNGLRIWALLSMSCISASNLLALWWLRQEYTLYNIVDRSSWVQGFMALAVMSLFVWGIVFHVRHIKAKQSD